MYFYITIISAAAFAFAGDQQSSVTMLAAAGIIGAVGERG